MVGKKIGSLKWKIRKTEVQEGEEKTREDKRYTFQKTKPEPSKQAEKDKSRRKLKITVECLRQNEKKAIGRKHTRQTSKNLDSSKSIMLDKLQEQKLRKFLQPIRIYCKSPSTYFWWCKSQISEDEGFFFLNYCRPGPTQKKIRKLGESI